MSLLRRRLRLTMEHIDALSLRERALLFVGVLVALYLIAANVVFGSLLGDLSRLDNELKSKREQVRTLQTQVEKIAAERGRDPNETNRARIAELKARLREREGDLTGAMQGVVSPREMARMVEQALSRNRGLTVVSVENLPPEPLVEGGGAPAEGQGNPGAGMYRHGLRIELTGQYPDILRYLRSLETLSWKVFWSEVQIKTEKHPVSRVTLVIYTLSLDEAWIGV